MKKVMIFVFLSAFVLTSVNAVWWNPLTWGKDGSSESVLSSGDSSSSCYVGSPSVGKNMKKAPVELMLSLGVSGGTISNLLYDQSGLKSETIWHSGIEGVFGLGVSLRIPYLYAGLSFDYSFMPFLWSGCKSLSYADGDVVEESNHSSTSGAYCINLDIGTNFDFDRSHVSPFFSIGFAGRKMSAKNGSSHNVVFDDDRDFSGKDVLNLNQKLITIGVGILFNISDILFLRTVFCPYFYSSIRTDYIQKGIVFKDLISGGIGIDLSLRFKLGNFGVVFGYRFLKNSGTIKAYVVGDSEDLMDGDNPGFKSSIWYLRFVFSFP